MMKVIFIVQGEGRGHMTQAITMGEMLRENGHEVVEVLVGSSKTRQLPDFFLKHIGAEVKTFLSPNFLPKPDNKRVSVTHSLAYNLRMMPTYRRSIAFIRREIERSGADIAIRQWYSMWR